MENMSKFNYTAEDVRIAIQNVKDIQEQYDSEIEQTIQDSKNDLEKLLEKIAPEFEIEGVPSEAKLDEVDLKTLVGILENLESLYFNVTN